MTNPASVAALLELVGIPSDFRFEAVFYALGRQDCIHAFNTHLARSMGREENPCSSLCVFDFCMELLDSLEVPPTLFKFTGERRFFYLGPNWLDESERLVYRVRHTDSISRVGPKGLHAAFSIAVEDLYLKDAALLPEVRRGRSVIFLAQPRQVQIQFKWKIFTFFKEGTNPLIHLICSLLRYRDGVSKPASLIPVREALGMVARDRRNDIARGLNVFRSGIPIPYVGCEGLPAFVLSGRQGDRVEHSSLPTDVHRHLGAPTRCPLYNRSIADGRFAFSPSDIPGSEVRGAHLISFCG